MGVSSNNMIRLQEEGRVSLAESIPLSTPFVIGVDPSSICNFKCNFCYQSSGKMQDKGIMKWDTYKKIISDIKEFDRPIKTLRLYAFGEPLINPRFSDMVEYAKKERICERIDTTTNASLLNPELSSRIINAGIDRINISVQGVSEESYKRISNYKINLNEFIENITFLYKNKKQCTIFIKTNGDIINEFERKKFLEIFTPISDGIAIEHSINCWPDFDVSKTNKEVGIYGQPLKEVDICSYIFYSMCIRQDGRASICFLDWGEKMIMGDVKNDSLKDIWNSPKMKAMRMIMLTDLRKSLNICGRCNQLIAGHPEDIDLYKDSLLKRFI
jgi:radical SAM protein with 4Fe4S-binding SPASM domain